MSEREYIVTLNVGVDYEAFNAEMIEETGAGDIPNRTVEVTNARPISQRNTHYSLTDEEASALAQDPRVAGVEIPPDQRDDLEIGFDAVQTGDFTKTNSDSGVYLNWGMRRCATTTNDYNTGNTVSGDYEYNLDGSGVDVVIHDSGLQVDHPEFQDADGVSRVQQIDWYTASGVSGTQDANHYRDQHGHGTHVAGTVAGKTYGWAKNARIYSIKVSGLEGTGDSGTGIPISDCFDVIKGWHANKPIDPATGYKRPTIVNMSWGYSNSNSYEPYDGYYRGTQWTYDNNNSGVATNLTTSADLQNRTGLPLWNDVYNGNPARKLNTRITGVDADVQELIDAGIHVCIASGNKNLTIDVNGGPDYDNRYRVYPVEAGASQPGGYIYYCRGSSPFSNDAFMVGNVDSATNSNDNLEQRASSSNHGPGVDIFAPGTRIMSACSNTNSIGGQDYNVDSNYKQANISGTSMASPQVCGVGALALQVNPHMTPAQLKTFLHNQSQSGKLREDANYANWTIADSDYSSSSSARYLAGAPDRFLYSPYPGQYKFRIQNT
jgi:subtilisin family serine protease